MAKAPTKIPSPPAPPSAAPTPPAAPPAAPPPPSAEQTNSGEQTGPLTGSAPPAPEPAVSGEQHPEGATPPAPAGIPNDGGENGIVTTNAEAKGAVLASDAQSRKAPDRDGDGEAGGSLPKDPRERADRISRMGFEDGKSAELKKDGEGRQPKQKPRDWTDDEYTRYTASYERGVQQRQVNEMSEGDRLRRVEAALGLMSPEQGDG